MQGRSRSALQHPIIFEAIVMMLRPFTTLVLTLFLLVFSGFSVAAQNNGPSLDDIMARQKGQAVQGTADVFKGAPRMVPNVNGPLGPLGATSDTELFRAYRAGSADIVSSDSGPTGTVVMQDGGMAWLKLRNGPLPTYGGYLLLGMLALILIFFIFRGKILIEGKKTGETIIRFKTLERIAHWLTAIPFILLGITGLISLFGRIAIIPLIGRETFSSVAIVGKFIHNYVAWAFMAGIIISFVLWVWDNLPDRTDIPWLLKGGGLFTKGSHPPAGKFNAGEKIIFWAVIGFGVLISITGISLLFPYQLNMFAPVFEVLNYLQIPQLLGMGELNTALAPQEEMQLAQLWHAIIAFIYMAIIIAHIYLGSVGMEGALSSMTNGKVETQWAKEHHSLWYEDMVQKNADKSSEP